MLFLEVSRKQHAIGLWAMTASEIKAFINDAETEKDRVYLRPGSRTRFDHYLGRLPDLPATYCGTVGLG